MGKCTTDFEECFILYYRDSPKKVNREKNSGESIAEGNRTTVTLSA